MQPNTWRYIQERDVSASYGLAVDEFLMNSIDAKSNELPAALRLYNYKNYSALAGRFQDINAEIDIESCNNHGFDYGRRLTGGGAIIMGEDQLGICLATSSRTFEWGHIRELYTLFSRPIINTLQAYGINAQFRSKNDLEVNGRKIAGLGVYVSPEGTIQFHISLLVDLDISQMLSLLQIPVQKYSDKEKVRSIGQRITTVSRELGREIPMIQIRNQIAKSFESFFDIKLSETDISPEETIQIQELERIKYKSAEWIFQNSPLADMTGMSLRKTPAGMLRTYIGLKGETIKSVLITGDFLDHMEVLNRIESTLKWSHLDKDQIEKNVESAFLECSTDHSGLNKEDIVQSIWKASQRALAADRYNYKGSCYYPDSPEVEPQKSKVKSQKSTNQ